MTLKAAMGTSGLIVDGDWVESKDQDPVGDVRLIQLADIGDGEYLNKSARFLTAAKARQLRCTMLRPGDVLISRMADPIGRACIFPGDPKPCVTVVDVCLARPDGRSVTGEWLKYAINEPRFRATVQSRAVGATRPRISGRNLQSIVINVPSLEEQGRTVDYLSRAENIVRMRREAEAKAKEVIPALFLDMFGDPATNPRGWEVARLETLSEVQGGLQVTRAREALSIEVPYLRVANVHRTHLDLSEVKKIRVTAAELERTRLRANDLLVIEGHGNPAEIGRVGIWTGGVDPCTHQNHLIRVRCDVRRLDPFYVWTALNSTGGRQALLRQGKTTSGLNTISVSNVKAVVLPLPPIDLQEVFGARVRDIQNICDTEIAAGAKSKRLFDALMAGAFPVPERGM